MQAPDHDSENEDRPRDVLNLLGEFITIADDKSSTPFKLQDLREAKLQCPDDTWVSGGPFRVRPVPEPSAVARAEAAMGNGNNGVWTGKSFAAPGHTSPEFMFPVRLVNSPYEARERFCIRRRFVPAVSNLETMMLYTDGACSFNGQTAPEVPPQGTYAFVFNNARGTYSNVLEQSLDPDGEVCVHTNTRAELRAVVSALRFRAWWGEGWKRVVIVTDSEYVGKGATIWMRNWALKGWRTAANKPVANRDLWETLSQVMGSYAAGGCEVALWVVPRRWNTLAAAAAKSATGPFVFTNVFI
ncbi:ribonuclease H-like domain-containing protein [Mycena polygramma]|nr:ribonuclease H-like domain-containing protein [Mycena polygramma]